MKNRILYIYHLGHPTSNACAKAIGAKFIRFKGIYSNNLLQALHFPLSSLFGALFFKKSNDRIYFGEGITAVYFPTFMRLLKREKNIIIVRANDDSFDISHKSFIKKKYYELLYKQINGLIPISELVMNDAKRYINIPMSISHTFLWKDFKHFSTPRKKQENICFVGHYRPHKNIDKLSEIFSILKEKYKYGGNFFLVGKGIKENLNKKNLMKEYFICPGSKDPIHYFSKSKYYIHLADYEAGGTSIIEAMAAGLIPIVNEKVGNKDLVKLIDSRLVIRNDSPKYMAKNVHKLIIDVEKEMIIEKLSKKAKKVAKNNDIKKGAGNFKKAFYCVLKEI